jgi:hypothetical protein
MRVQLLRADDGGALSAAAAAAVAAATTQPAEPASSSVTAAAEVRYPYTAAWCEAKLSPPTSQVVGLPATPSCVATADGVPQHGLGASSWTCERTC